MGSDRVVNGAAAEQRARGVSDRRAELMFGALACVVLLLIAIMVVIVFAKAWPSFRENGLAWFGAPDEPKETTDSLQGRIFDNEALYKFRAWPLIAGTVLTTGGAIVFGLVLSLLSAIFIVEFAPERLRRVLEPVVRLLAAVPSVVYGLIGVLVLVPFVGNHLITEKQRESVAGIIQLDGAGLAVAVVILTVMITPIMVAITVDALRAVPRSWREGSAALGVNRWRTIWRISVRTARPAIVAAVVLATARALGEAIMLSMVSGSVSFAPNPFDGIIFFVEPTRTFAADVVDQSEALSTQAGGQTLYAVGAVLMVSALFLSFAGWAAKRPLRRYGLL